MKIENVKSFVHYGVNLQQTKEQIIFGGFGIVAMAMLIGIFGFGYPQTLWTSVAAYLLSLLYLVLLSIFSKKLDLKKRIQCSALTSIFAVVLFTLSAAILLLVKSVPYVVLICFIPGLLAILSFLISYIRLKKNKYVNKRNNPKYNKMLSYAAIGSTIGALIFKTFLKRISFEIISAEVLVAILLEGVACLFAFMGAPVILKWYYIWKFSKQGVDLGY